MGAKSTTNTAKKYAKCGYVICYTFYTLVPPNMAKAFLCSLTCLRKYILENFEYVNPLNPENWPQDKDRLKLEDY